MTYQELEIQINNLIAKDEIEAAIALLSTYFSGHEALKDIVLQSGRYHSLRRDQRSGVVDYATVQQTLNQLRASILEFVRSVKSANLPGHGIQTTADIKHRIVAEFRPALAKVAVLLLLKRKEAALTITEIYQLSRVKSRKHIHEVIKIMEELELVEREKRERINYWKLSQKGRKLAMDVEQTISQILE
ncbi:MAG: hypothetical protein KDD02_17265 [Phaeodactylibacter sp.]|nr:hypothetical protein [Phaeodactylibacter sp.]MCB9299115.1 hypothetical protein [Lewinellaceae bacterium]